MTHCHGWKQRIALLALLLLVAGTLTTLTAPPASASYYEEGVSFSGKIVRDSVAYRFHVRAIVDSMGGGQRLDLLISKLKDPKGATKLRQTQEWTYELEAGDAYWEGRTFHLEAGSDNGPFQMHVHAERRKGSRCSEGQYMFTSVADGGTFRIETGNDKFETITKLPKCADDWYYSSGMAPAPPCPFDGTQLESSVLTASKRRGSDVVRINIYRSKQRSVSNEEATWSVRLRGTLPDRKLRLNRELDGFLSGRGAPWLKGRAHFNPGGAVRGGNWENCRDEKREARVISRRGSLGGDLVLNEVGYGGRLIRSRDALVTRAWVRQRT